MQQFSDISAGHLIVKQLENEGVSRVYCVPGESYLDVLDGLYDSSIHTVVCRQEGGVGMAAMAEGRLTGRAGVAMVTRGPGAANASIAVHNAWQDGTPIVLFVGLVDSREREREAFQDFSLGGWYATTAKRVFTIDNPAEAARVVRDAFAIAESGKPGPVVVGLPEDLLKHRVTATTEDRPDARPAVPSAADLDDVIARLRGATAPAIILGGEVWSAEAARAAAELGEALAVPVATDFRAADLVDNDSPAYVGMLGYGRDPELSALIADSDVLLFIGTGRADVLSDGYTIGGDALTIIASPDPELQGHHGRVDVSFTVDPSVFTIALAERAVAAGGAPAEAKSARLAAARAAFEKYSTPAPDGSRYADLGRVMEAVSELKKDDAIVTFGAGNYAIWPQRYLPSRAYPSLVAPKNGAMGLGIPAAVGAAMSHPDRQVISFAGDGCFMMNGQEVATAVAEGANLTIFVFDNGIYGTIRVHQERDYPGRISGTRLTNPDFAKYADAFGGTGFTLDGTQDAREVVAEAFATPGVTIVHVKADPEVREPRPQA
ncbi:acetolactate synthase [Leucobacter sp. CSA2]|uniref:Acetolactate synthase n=1 Tax=Leucobacter edaphi TaxID=2796472 RepID=A0A934QC40_9MICO|nr:thiamine pyrophosphate-dependent enzyme [Leucobacter edaphi]MBK0421919.1 acetolactate synthase [Leucobacter edaphi]